MIILSQLTPVQLQWLFYGALFAGIPVAIALAQVARQIWRGKS